MGFRVQGLGFRVWGLGFRVQGFRGLKEGRRMRAGERLEKNTGSQILATEQKIAHRRSVPFGGLQYLGLGFRVKGLEFRV